ncbi:potassium-transporting ATPase subunit F [Chitinasiproducens palmae]|uniref:F subunit of K+-transporting ATPase (Potass_KdpF) n=1 Tax=Chitinasiproducens palmae TaxID=1770053 RepID=A0A1H2PKX1_9BURK|nr:potassium-transporting ATPase subunit F [Chitinasiproducens palmae]SDV47081.1 F subunit of K+-transporting ATPase (Potass_KdpF) [Chitinasiproducens palmae]
MNWMLWLAGGTTALILAYLIYALLNAEHLE